MRLTAKLTIPVVAGEPKPFKLSINLMWLWEAIGGAKRSDGRGSWYARASIVDHISLVQLDNTNGESGANRTSRVTQPGRVRDGSPIPIPAKPSNHASANVLKSPNSFVLRLCPAKG